MQAHSKVYLLVVGSIIVVTCDAEGKKSYMLITFSGLNNIRPSYYTSSMIIELCLMWLKGLWYDLFQPCQAVSYSCYYFQWAGVIQPTAFLLAQRLLQIFYVIENASTRTSTTTGTCYNYNEVY
jgi:hypothetical protein